VGLGQQKLSTSSPFLGLIPSRLAQSRRRSAAAAHLPGMDTNNVKTDGFEPVLPLSELAASFLGCFGVMLIAATYA
jgi:hypothetical protein